MGSTSTAGGDRIVRLLAGARRSLLAVACLALGAGSAAAQQSRPVYVPVTFDAEGTPLRTSACLLVSEIDFGPARWWEEGATGKVPPAAQALRGIFSAMRARDRAALLAGSDAGQTKDAQRFNQQADLYFSQIRSLQLLEVPKAYEFDGEVLFFVKFKGANETAFVPMSFTKSGASYKFLPMRSDLVSYRMLRDWFSTAWGPGKSETPSYCSDAEVKRATHRVSPAASVPAEQRTSVLLFTGAPVDAPGALAPAVARVKAAEAELKAAAKQGIPALIAVLPKSGASRLEKWAATATEPETDFYKKEVLEQEPFFLFDLSTVLVVFSKAGESVEVLYFAPAGGSGESVKWMNSARVTTLDAVFKTAMKADAALEKPFSTLLAR